MVNSCCSFANKWLSEQGTNAYSIVKEGVLASSIYIVSAAVMLPFRALGYCNSGEHYATNRELQNGLRYSGAYITHGVAMAVLKFLNPYAKTGVNILDSSGSKALNYFTSKTIDQFASSTYFFNRQVTTRLCYALKIPAAAVARAVDAVIGSVALAFAFALAARNEKLNNIVNIHSWDAGMILGDLFECVLGFLNPNAFTRPKTI